MLPAFDKSTAPVRRPALLERGARRGDRPERRVPIRGQNLGAGRQHVIFRESFDVAADRAPVGRDAVAVHEDDRVAKGIPQKLLRARRVAVRRDEDSKVEGRAISHEGFLRGDRLGYLCGRVGGRVGGRADGWMGGRTVMESFFWRVISKLYVRYNTIVYNMYHGERYVCYAETRLLLYSVKRYVV